MASFPDTAHVAGAALRCQPDSRLVRLTREGHDRAFEEIVRRYRASLVAFAGAIVPAHRAEDVVQEALARAHSAIAAGDTDIRVKPWLYTIVRNRALNDLRDEPSHEQLDESFDGVPQPPDVAARREEIARLVERMKELPEAQRAALVQRELEGRSHEEIAAAIGATPGAVRALIFRARTALRDGVGLLIPLPLLRSLADGGPWHSETGGAGAAGAAATLTAGGGGVALKAGGMLAVGILAVGSGVALHDRGHGRDRTVAQVAGTGSHGHHAGARHHPSGGANGGPGATGPETSNRGPGGGGATRDPGSGGGGASGGDASSGPDHMSSQDPGPGGGGGSGGADDGHSGTSGDDGHSGTGGDGGGLARSGDGGGSGGDDGGSTTSGSGGSTSSGPGSGSDDGGSSSGGGSTSSGDGSSGSDDTTTVSPDATTTLRGQD
jgi:RNA polymerase sigma factor (sigma-70 family)